jgi:hypothetical protein
MSLSYQSRALAAGNSWTLQNLVANSLSPEWWRLVHLQARLVASATVGNRRLTAEILDGSSNIIDRSEVNVNIAASNTGIGIWSFAAGQRDTSFDAAGVAFTYVPRQFIQPNFTLRVRDRAAVDAADQLEVFATLSATPKPKVDEGAYFAEP